MLPSAVKPAQRQSGESAKKQYKLEFPFAIEKDMNCSSARMGETLSVSGGYHPRSHGLNNSFVLLHHSFFFKPVYDLSSAGLSNTGAVRSGQYRK